MMWKVAVFLFIAAVSSAAAQEPLNIDCQFLESFFGEYVCRLVGIEVLNPEQEVIIGGEHLEGRTNADVRVIQIRNSNTPFVIPQIFAAFSNALEFDVQNSNLQSLSFPEGVRLEFLTLYRNNISRIENGSFIGQSELLIIEAENNGIEEIEQDAFVGLENLFALTLVNNRIRVLTPGIFDPLVNVFLLDFERNLIERIENGTFSRNVELSSLYLEFNQIDAVATSFTADFGENLQSINFIGNRCVDRGFVILDPIDLIVINNALNSCFNNFAGQVRETRRITLEFQGPLSLFDEFGNIIARVN